MEQMTITIKTYNKELTVQTQQEPELSINLYRTVEEIIKQFNKIEEDK